jgi:hypothetical protein
LPLPLSWQKFFDQIDRNGVPILILPPERLNGGVDNYFAAQIDQ